MINQLCEVPVQCPYCWETFTLVVDASIESQEYIEDCEVCCRPIEFAIEIGADERPRITARHQDE